MICPRCVTFLTLLEVRYGDQNTEKRGFTNSAGWAFYNCSTSVCCTTPCCGRCPPNFSERLFPQFNTMSLLHPKTDCEQKKCLNRNWFCEKKPHPKTDVEKKCLARILILSKKWLTRKLIMRRKKMPHPKDDFEKKMPHPKTDFKTAVVMIENVGTRTGEKKRLIRKPILRTEWRDKPEEQSHGLGM